MATTRKPHSLLDINLIFTDFEKTNKPLNVEENTCTVCFENYNYGNNICYLSCGHSFHFSWLRRNISCLYVEIAIYDIPITSI